PALIAKLAISIWSNSFNPRMPGSIVRRLTIKRHVNFAIQPVVQQLPVVVSGLNWFAANRQQVVTYFHFDPVFVCRAIFVNVSNTITAGGVVGLQLNSQIPG